MKEISKDSTIEEVLKFDESLGDVFLGFGMHCLSCPVSRMETLEEASQVHGIDVDFLIKKLKEEHNFKVKGKVKSPQKIKKGNLKQKK